MATTIATVTPDGLLAVPANVMAELDLKPGAQISVTLGEKPREVPLEMERLIRETRGMFAGAPSMAEELIQDRREDDHRFHEKW